MRVTLGGFTAEYVDMNGINFIFVSHVLSNDVIYCYRTVLKDIETLQRTLIEFITYGSFMSDLEKMAYDIEHAEDVVEDAEEVEDANV